MTAPHSEDTKTEALKLYLDHGPAEAAHRTGIKYKTIQSWARAANLRYLDSKREPADEEHKQRLTMHRAETAERLYVEANQLMDQMHEPTVEKKTITLSGGQHNPATWEIVEIERDQPTFGEQKAIMTSAAIALDKAQLLAGEATERSERVDPAVARAKVEKAFDELAARREAG